MAERATDLPRSRPFPSHHRPCVPSLSTPGMTIAARTRYPRPLLPSPAMRRLGHPFSQATQLIGPVLFMAPHRVPFWYGPQVRLSSLAGAWKICRITSRTRVAPRLRSQANEFRVIARGRTLHLPDDCESRPVLIATRPSRSSRGSNLAAPGPPPNRRLSHVAVVRNPICFRGSRAG
jgi:hypothetical protein